jgi:hypothetical protein
MKKFESKAELRKYIRLHIPVMVKGKTGRLVEIFRTNNGFQTVVEQLADALWEEPSEGKLCRFWKYCVNEQKNRNKCKTNEFNCYEQAPNR